MVRLSRECRQLGERTGKGGININLDLLKIIALKMSSMVTRQMAAKEKQKSSWVADDADDEAEEPIQVKVKAVIKSTVATPGIIPVEFEQQLELVFADFQYSQRGQTIYPKEISALHNVSGSKITFFVQGPPMNLTTTDAENRCFKRQFNIHQIPWKVGEVTDWVAKLSISVPQQTSQVYTKGLVKAKFLMDNGWVNVTDLDTQVAREQHTLAELHGIYHHLIGKARCQYHAKRRGMCASANVSVMRLWYRALTKSFDECDCLYPHPHPQPHPGIRLANGGTLMCC